MGIAETNEKIKELEKELAETKYNKRTQAAIGLLKAKIARLKGKQELAQSKKSHAFGYSIKKSGDSTVVLVGFPSVGKSTLLNRLTNAKSETGAYAFTTLKPIPGVMQYNDANIQVIDVPGIIYGAATNKGRGKEVMSIMRNADLLLVLLDIFHLDHYHALIKEIQDANIRVNQKKPKVVINKRSKGGISVSTIVPLKESKEVLKNVAKELGIINADITIYDTIGVDEFIDAIEGNRVYNRVITVINKYDQIDYLTKKQKKEFDAFVKKYKPLLVSAGTNYNVDKLKKLIFDKLHLIRIYTKEKIKGVDMNEPIILRANSSLKDVGRHLHKEFLKKFKYVKIWGKSAKFDGQVFRNLDHIVQDKDIVEFFLN